MTEEKMRILTALCSNPAFVDSTSGELKEDKIFLALDSVSQKVEKSLSGHMIQPGGASV